MHTELIAVLLTTLAVSAQDNPNIFSAGIQFVARSLTEDRKEPRDERNILKEYDFIIVGAGSAGCILANRLTEVPEWKVLLIEAGQNENFIMDIPIAAGWLQMTDANWNYKTVPSNSACLGMTNRQCNFPRGKVIGGSSVLNYMIYNRGNRRDYDNWEAMGNPGWSWNDVLPSFKKSEDMAIPELAKDKKFHSTGGYLTVDYPPYRTPLADAFLAAGVETGQPLIDYNGETQTGFSYVQATMKNGSRWSASRAFLRPINGRRNLHVKKRCLVTRILIDPKTKIAYGVEFQRERQTYIVHARKEVIISAGSINSPQLLMMSGIGPKNHLRNLKIPVVQNLKVGYNLMDHVVGGGIIFLINQSVSITTYKLARNPEILLEYMLNHSGPASVAGGCEAIAFYDLKQPNNTDGYPDIELAFAGASFASDDGLKLILGIDDELYNKVYRPIRFFETWSVWPILLRPKSRGRIALQSKDPYVKPLIYHNYFTDPDDVKTLVKGIKLAVELQKTRAFQKFGSKLHDVPLPGCKDRPFGSDEYWECAARHLSLTLSHQSGTCKMGPSSDRRAVVDPRLKVHGVKNLRIVDASIMPAITASHTNAPTYMIAEKGADMIKEDWKIFDMRSK